MSIKRKEKLGKFPHLLAGFLILVHGYERFESGHSTYIIFFICGLLFLAVALFHHTLTTKYPFVDVVFFFVEGILCFIISYEYFEQGKKGIPFAYALAGLLQWCAIFIFIRRKKKSLTQKTAE